MAFNEITDIFPFVLFNFRILLFKKKRKERKTALEELSIETVSTKQGKNWLVFKYVPVFTLNLSLDLGDGDVTNSNLL